MDARERVTADGSPQEFCPECGIGVPAHSLAECADHLAAACGHDPSRSQSSYWLRKAASALDCAVQCCGTDDADEIDAMEQRCDELAAKLDTAVEKSSTPRTRQVGDLRHLTTCGLFGGGNCNCGAVLAAVLANPGGGA